jgi:hypothetical protein
MYDWGLVASIDGLDTTLMSLSITPNDLFLILSEMEIEEFNIAGGTDRVQSLSSALVITSRSGVRFIRKMHQDENTKTGNILEDLENLIRFPYHLKSTV